MGERRWLECVKVDNVLANRNLNMKMGQAIGARWSVGNETMMMYVIAMVRE